MSHELKRKGKRTRAQLTFSDTYGVLDNLRNYDFDLVSFYVTFSQYIDRSLYKGTSNSLIFKNTKSLCKAFNISKNKFYRLLKLAYKSGLIDVEKGTCNRNIYILNDDIALETLKNIREWDDRFDDKSSKIAKEKQSDQNGTTLDEEEIQLDQIGTTQIETTQIGPTYNSSNIINNSNVYKSVNKSKGNINNRKKKDNKSQIDRETQQREVENFNRILGKCDLELLSDKGKRDAVEESLKRLYFSKDRLNIGDNYIPLEMVKSSMEKLSLPVIEHALKKFEKASSQKEIKSTIAYLKICIYNSISEMPMDIEAQLRHKGII